jgi:hypothetical protein
MTAEPSAKKLFAGMEVQCWLLTGSWINGSITAHDCAIRHALGGDHLKTAYPIDQATSNEQ